MTTTEICKATPMTERFVKKRLAKTKEIALYHSDNVKAYRYRQFELHYPFLAKLIGWTWTIGV